MLSSLTRTKCASPSPSGSTRSTYRIRPDARSQLDAPGGHGRRPQGARARGARETAVGMPAGEGDVALDARRPSSAAASGEQHQQERGGD